MTNLKTWVEYAITSVVICFIGTAVLSKVYESPQAIVVVMGLIAIFKYININPITWFHQRITAQ